MNWRESEFNKFLISQLHGVMTITKVFRQLNNQSKTLWLHKCWCQRIWTSVRRLRLSWTSYGRVIRALCLLKSLKLEVNHKSLSTLSLNKISKWEKSKLFLLQIGTNKLKVYSEKKWTSLIKIKQVDSLNLYQLLCLIK